jgi:hypothetical protein
VSKHKKRQWNTIATMSAIHSLQYRATERCSGLGHELGGWSPAKRKKHGVASQQAMCAKCGEMVFVSPYMEYTKEHPQVPAIKGDILFQPCYSQGRLM